MRSKVTSLLGFASRAGALVAGAEKCLAELRRGRLELLIITEEVGDKSRKRLLQKCNSYSVECREFGSAEEMSHITGKEGRGVFGIIESGFADDIRREIDRIRSGRKVF